MAGFFFYAIKQHLPSLHSSNLAYGIIYLSVTDMDPLASQRTPSPASSRSRQCRSPSPMSDQEITPEPQSRASDTNHNVNGRSLDKPSAPARPTTYPQIHRKSSEPPLRYRKTPLWLLVLYLATLIVPWVLTCILDKRPLTASTYHDQRGRVDVSGYLSFWRVLAFVYALRAISGILTIPVTSVILAHAAVRYAQRCHPDQKLNMRQLFALADRGWADISILWHPKKSGKSSWLLWLGALLVLIGLWIFISKNDS